MGEGVAVGRFVENKIISFNVSVEARTMTGSRTESWRMPGHTVWSVQSILTKCSREKSHSSDAHIVHHIDKRGFDCVWKQLIADSTRIRLLDSAPLFSIEKWSCSQPGHRNFKWHSFQLQGWMGCCHDRQELCIPLANYWLRDRLRTNCSEIAITAEPSARIPHGTANSNWVPSPTTQETSKSQSNTNLSCWWPSLLQKKSLPKLKLVLKRIFEVGEIQFWGPMPM